MEIVTSLLTLVVLAILGFIAGSLFVLVLIMRAVSDLGHPQPSPFVTAAGNPQHVAVEAVGANDARYDAPPGSGPDASRTTAPKSRTRRRCAFCEAVRAALRRQVDPAAPK